ncbi:MAG: hypothetical protein HUU06_01400 [Planctomycetaceae bacterium]|nr:hypothetical protein [Planctomycetaceae bacterium]
MRPSTGPPRVHLAALIILCLAIFAGCMSTRQKVGSVVTALGTVVESTGGVLEAVGDAILNGPAEDATDAAETLGLASDAKEAPKAEAPIPTPATDAPAPTGAQPTSSTPCDAEDLLLAPQRRPSGMKVPEAGVKRARLAAGDLYDPPNDTPAKGRQTTRCQV